MLEQPSKGKTKISGKYKVKQPMENFRVRVKIVQQKSQLAELFENEDETRDGNFLEHEEYEFGWQEKVLGPYEVKYYRDERNCATDKHKEYRQRILEKTDGDEGSRLYSYVPGDAYYPDSNLLTRRFKSCLSLRNERAIPSIKNLKPFAHRYNKLVVDEKPSDARIRENHYLYKEHESMYIVVDLTSKDGTSVDSTDSETLLCTISYDPLRRCLTVHPDFNDEDGECYRVEGVGMNYDYWISHASPKPTSRELQRQRETAKRELQRIRSLKETQLFHELEAPGTRSLRVFLVLDICLARDFDYDDALFVTYQVELPSQWRSSGHLKGRTQRCRARQRQANFSYCTEMMLELEDRDDIAASWPYIVFSVASFDPWTRYRIEGYGSLPLPRTPGQHELELKTWRPRGSVVDRLRRFFTGGSRELEDPGYCAIPASREGSILDKRGLRVVPSGSLELRMNLAWQCLGDMGLFPEGRPTDELLLGGVDDVLGRFKEARERMIQARAMCA